MKLLPVLSLSFLMVVNNKQVSNAQSFADNHKTVKVAVGVNELDHADVIANRYTFDYRIYKIYFDSLAGNAVIQLRDVSADRRSNRNVGDYLLFDLNSNMVKWNNPITYTESFLNQNTNILLDVHRDESYKMNMKTGKEETSYNGAIFYIDKQSQTGLACGQLTKGESVIKLGGIDLANGHFNWLKEVKRDYSRCVSSRLNDSMMLFITSGLHVINLRTGTGWDYNANTGDKKYKAPDQKAAQSDIGGLERSNYKVFYGRSRVHGAESNVLDDGNYFYYASKEAIAKINKFSGEVGWSFDLKKDAGVSWLYLKDSLLFMISSGYAIKGDAIKGEERVSIGKPFITVFDKNTGRRITQSTLPKKDIIATKYIERKLLLLFEDGMGAYDLSNHQLEIRQNVLDDRDDVYVAFFENEQYVRKEGNLSAEFNRLDSNKLHVITGNGNLTEFDNNLNLIETYNDTLLYYVKGGNSKFKILSKEEKNEMVVIDQNTNKVTAHFNAPSNSVLIKNKLYGIEDNVLVETDVSEIMK